MLLDATLPPVPLSMVPMISRAAEEMGFDALWSTETKHDPFLPGALFSEHTKVLKYGTAVAVSFARSPGTIAYTAWDLAQASQGRFILGLGTQVKAHIERRFGLSWPESPVNLLRDQIAAVRALWHAWQTGDKLNLRNEHYKLTLMSPFFNPGPIEAPQIPVYIAGVNTGMAKLAGEVADGFLVHPFHSPRYLREVIRPAIQRGTEKSKRSRDSVSVSVTAITITNPEEREFARQQLSFYASTPSYRPVMALHGWKDEAEKLSGLASRSKWDQMSQIVTDEMLEQFGTIATLDELPEKLYARYRGIADRLTIYTPFVPRERDSFWEYLLNCWRQFS